MSRPRRPIIGRDETSPTCRPVFRPPAGSRATLSWTAAQRDRFATNACRSPHLLLAAAAFALLSGLVLLFCGWIVLYFYAACTAQLARNDSTGTRPSKWWLVIVLPLTLLTLSLLGRAVTRASGFRAFSMPSTSMEKTILQGDELVADMRYYHSHRPERREAVIFLRDGTFYVKRIIAVGGDSIRAKTT